MVIATVFVSMTVCSAYAWPGFDDPFGNRFVFKLACATKDKV